MKCINCTAEILPQYVHSIANNICPGCGGSIYDDQTKELYNQLKEAMEKMPNDPAGLAGWLLDNYKLYKIGSAEPVEKFYNSSLKEPSAVKNNKIKTSSAEKTNEFFQRAGVSPQTKNKSGKDYNSLVKQINESIEEDMYGGDDQEDEVDMGTGYTNDDLMAAHEMGAQFSAEEELIIPGKPLAKNEMKELQNMLNKSSPTAESVLESERMMRLQRQENMLTGGGGFKR